MARTILFILFTSQFFMCNSAVEKHKISSVELNEVSLAILGVAQDAGYPQIACAKKCCKDMWGPHADKKMVSCVGIIDPINRKKWVVDATPDFKDQTYRLKELGNFESAIPDGVLLTHAHIGHYTGLMHLGKEALGAKDIPVYAMPKMKNFLSHNGPWDQLVKTNNIAIVPLQPDSIIKLSDQVSIKPITVPHRDEYSETVGFVIYGPKKSALFIPDIDKWDKWDRDIKEEISEVDYALLDGTFYSNGEIPGRDMSLIPHPFIEESMVLFEDLAIEEKEKIHFIHLNHTNPLLKDKSIERSQFEKTNFNLAEEGQLITL